VVRRFQALALLALLGAAPMPIAAQAPATGSLPPRRLLLFFEALPTAQLADSQRLLLYESLLIRLGRASERVHLLEHGSGAGDSDEARSQAALDRKADSWIQVTVDGSWEGLKISVRSYDVLRQALTLDFALQKAVRRGALELERGFWDELAVSVRETYTQAGLPVTETVQPVTLQLQAVPGTRIWGFTPEPIKTGPDGTVTADVLLPATFEYRAARRGYNPLNEMVFLSPGQESYALPQQRGARWSLDFYLYQFGFPGFDVAWYPLHGSWFVKLGLNTFLLGVMLGGNDQEELFTSLSLSHLNLSTGLYLSAADRRFRFYLATGLFARIITAADLIVTIDPIAPFGIQPVLGVEFGRQPKRRFYLEYAPPFYYAPDARLLWLSISPDNPASLLPIPFERVLKDGKLQPEPLYDWAFMWELFVFRLGVRVVL
jgi:hypothetical protein